MKSVSAQWELFKNRVHAAATVAGASALPLLLDLLNETTLLARDGMPPLEEAVSRLAPFFRALRDMGADVLDIFTSLLSAVAPLTKALLGLAVTSVIGALNALATALAAVFNFVDDHKTAFQVLAAIIATLLVPQVFSLSVAFNRLILTPIVFALVTPFLALSRALTGATTLTEGLTASMGALATAEGAATAGITALAAVGVIGMSRLANATQSAKGQIDRLTTGFNPADPRGAAAYIQQLTAFVDEAGSKFDNLTRGARGASVLGLGPGTQDLKNLEQGRKRLDELQDSAINTLRNAGRLGEQLGVVGQVVLDYAQKNNIDLSKPWELSADAIQQIREGLQGLAGDVRCLTRRAQGRGR
jgi:hypothetical protein